MTNQNGISTLWIVHSPVPKGIYSSKPHSHGFFHLLYILEGQLATKISGKPVILKEGMMSVIPPNVQHNYTEVQKETKLFEVKFFSWNPELSSAISKLPSGFSIDDNSKNLIVLLLEDIHKHGNFNETTINSGVYFLLNRIVEKYLKESLKSESVSHFSPYGKTDKMVSYIVSNIANNITLEEIAEHAGYSRNYASTLFRENHGITISHFINRVRIQKACELIAYQIMPISEVCRQCGFSDIHNFGRTFKKMMGISPGKYRHAHNIRDVEILEKTKAQQPLDKQYFTLAVAAQKLIQYSNLLSFIQNEPTTAIELPETKES